MKNFFGGMWRALTKPLAVCAMAAGLTFGGVSGASAATWDFSYSGSGISVAGTFNSVWYAPWNAWVPTSISGTRIDTNGCTGSGCAITGIWGTDSYWATAPYWPLQIKLEYTAGGNNFIFAWFPAWGPTENGTDNAGADYGNQGFCPTTAPGCYEINQFSIEEVPEINAAAGLQALAVLLAIALIMRELFVRRRWA